jgi:hypothetical protein
MKALLSTGGWWAAVAAKYLDLPQMRNVTLLEWRQRTVHAAAAEDDAGISRADLESLMRRLKAGQLSPEAMAAEMEAIRQQRQAQRNGASVETLAAAIEDNTGVPRSVWEQASNEVLEAISPRLSGATRSLAMDSDAGILSRSMGLEDVSVVIDFPITTAVYGFSRADYQPALCRLNAFPPDRDSGRLPVFTDVVEADAIMVRLDPHRVCRWLETVGHPPRLPAGTSADMATRAYFVSTFGDVSLRATLDDHTPQARLVFGLLHTLSHVCVRQAALLCGLDRNSLSEYVLPRALTFAIYCNHRFGATIGALVSLFEQALPEWLRAVAGNRHCVYDPVCRDRGGSCHSCTHLAETSCRFFNLNLGRQFLHGGIDPELGEVPSGYFDPILGEV